MDDKLTTIAAIAKILELPESTVRYYRDRFSVYIPVEGKGRNRRYPPEAINVLRMVAEGLRNNLTAMEVEQQLSHSFSKFIDVEQEPQQPTTAAQQQSYLTLAEREREIQSRERLTAALEMLANQKAAIERIEEHSKELKDKDQAREMELQELRARVDKLEMPERKPWWKRLF